MKQQYSLIAAIVLALAALAAAADPHAGHNITKSGAGAAARVPP